MYRSDHRAVVQALTERDAAKAQLAMRRHLQRVRSHLLGDDHHRDSSGRVAASLLRADRL